MKTEAEIRKHLADLRTSMARPCDCHRRGLLALAECNAGKRLNAGAIQVLSWALEQNSEYDRVVEMYAAEAKRG